MKRALATKPLHFDLAGAEVTLTKCFFSEKEADAYAAELIAQADWEQQTLKIFGREVAAPRLSAWYGDPGAAYAYSGIRLEPKPWLPALREIRDRLELTTRRRFNSVLLNLYRDGRDGMGWHSDDEPELGVAPTIASLSFGGTRRFLLRHRTRRDLETLTLQPEHGTLILMSGSTQRHWKHSVPKTARPAEPRLNLSYRAVRGSD